MEEQDFEKFLAQTKDLGKEDRKDTAAWENRVVSRMVATVHREEERLENHLLEMPLSVIVYQWVIVRLKSRPWRLLIPVSVALSLILQGLLSRVNMVQFLGH